MGMHFEIVFSLDSKLSCHTAPDQSSVKSWVKLKVIPQCDNGQCFVSFRTRQDIELLIESRNLSPDAILMNTRAC